MRCDRHRRRRSGAAGEAGGSPGGALGKKILAESGLPIISAGNMAEAGQKVVAAVRGAR